MLSLNTLLFCILRHNTEETWLRGKHCKCITCMYHLNLHIVFFLYSSEASTFTSCESDRRGNSLSSVSLELVIETLSVSESDWVS